MTFNLVKFIVDEMTGSGDGDVSILIVGSRGSGKSDLALDIIDGVSEELALRLQGNEAKWKDYFDPAKDCGIMLDDNLLKILAAKVDDYHIKFLDDIGFSKGFNSRKHASSENDATTSLFAINRTNRGLLVCTVQSHMFVDNKLRSLFKVYIEVNGPHDWEDSLNFSGLHKITLHPRDNSKPIHFPHPREYDKEDNHKIIYTTLASGMAKPEIRDVYSPMRKAVVDMVNDEKFGKLFKNDEKDGDDAGASDKSKSDQFYDWLHNNQDLLEKRPNNKYYPSQHIMDEFYNNTGLTLSGGTARPIISKVRKEMVR